MAYQVEVADKKAYEWLKKLIDNTITSPTSRPYQNNYYELMQWKEAFDKCDQEQEEALAKRREARETSKKKARNHTPVKRKVKEVSDFDCPDHTTYGGIRVPRTDCKKCWSIYKKLHPMEYDRARRKFNLKQRQDASR